MNFLNLLFYFIASVVLVSSVLMITVNKTVNAALLLVVIFFNMAIIWLLLGAEFLGIVLVLVYVGAVLVLFLFVVMMLAKQDLVDNSKNKYFITSAIISTIMFVELYLIINTLNDNQFVSDKFIQIDNTLVQKTAIALPDEFLKEWLKLTGEGKVTDAEIENEYSIYADQLRWNLISGQVAKDNEIKPEHDDIKEATRKMIEAQFMGSGMDQFADQMDTFIEN